MQNKHKKQKGYAAVLTLVLFSALSLSLFAVFNSGQIVTHKLKLQNAVDSATYSAVNVVAREMNYMAYTNRAMVANQVAVGQLVALSSWSKQMVEVAGTINEIGKYAKYIPVVGTIIYTVTETLDTVVNAGDKLAQLAIKASVLLEQSVIRALSASQTAVHLATSVSFAKTFDTVLKDNNKRNNKDDPSISLAAILPADGKAKSIPSLLGEAVKTVASGKSPLTPFLSGYERMVQVSAPDTSNNTTQDDKKIADFKRYQSVIRNSADDFVATSDAFGDKGRSYRWYDSDLVELLTLGLVDAYIDKQGGNKFEMKSRNGEYQWEWSAMDTVTFVIDKPWWLGGDTELAMGWGAAHATTTDNYKTYGCNNSKEWGNTTRYKKNCRNARSDYKDNKVSLSLSKFFGSSSSQRGKVTLPSSNKSNNKNGTQVDQAAIDKANNKSTKSNNILTKAFDRLGISDVVSTLVGSKVNSFYKFKNSGNQVIGAEFLAVVKKDETGVRTRNRMMELQTGNKIPNDSSLNIEKNGNMNGNQHQMFSIAKGQVYFVRSFEKKIVTAIKNFQKKPHRDSSYKINNDANQAGRDRLKQGHPQGKDFTETKPKLDEYGRIIVDYDGNEYQYETETVKHNTVANCILQNDITTLQKKRNSWGDILWAHSPKNPANQNDNGSPVSIPTITDEQKRIYQPTQAEYQKLNTPVCDSIDGFVAAHKHYKTKEKKEYAGKVENWKDKRDSYLNKSQYSRARFDSKVEYANLFNPYWQVRLVDYKFNDIKLLKEVLK